MNGLLTDPSTNLVDDSPTSSQTSLDFKALLMSGVIRGYLSRVQILGNPRAKPKPIPPLINVKKTFFYEGILSGKYPAPVPTTGKYAMWRCEDILEVIKRMEKED